MISNGNEWLQLGIVVDPTLTHRSLFSKISAD